MRYADLISQETLAARFAAQGLDCAVRHLDGFIGNCRYQAYFPGAESAQGWLGSRRP